MKGNLNTIESVNARNVVNGISAKWSLIKLHQHIQGRYSTLVAQIDYNEIAILGGDDAYKEVLIFNTESRSAEKVVTEASIEIFSGDNMCVMPRNGQVIAIDGGELIQFRKNETDIEVLQS